MEKTKKIPVKSKAIKKTEKNNVRNKKQHWIESRAHLGKILEASGVVPEQCAVMITCCHEDR